MLGKVMCEEIGLLKIELLDKVMKKAVKMALTYEMLTFHTSPSDNAMRLTHQTCIIAFS